MLYSDSEVSDVTIGYYISKIDIDEDGFINSEDLDVFLSRYTLLENTSFREFFNKLDINKDGLISFDEFKEGLAALYPFSDEIAQGLFAYMDRQHIGMIDFNNYLKVMKKSVLDDMKEGAEDNFDWQIGII